MTHVPKCPRSVDQVSASGEVGKHQKKEGIIVLRPPITKVRRSISFAWWILGAKSMSLAMLNHVSDSLFPVKLCTIHRKNESQVIVRNLARLNTIKVF